jgi:hypothetical protein
VEIRGRGRRSSIPLEFNVGWIKDVSFNELVKSIWIPFNPNIHGTASPHFVDNLKCLKKATIPWAYAKRVRDDCELMHIDNMIQTKQESVGWGYNTLDDKKEMVCLETRKRVLFTEKEETWHLKSITLWLKCGD